MTKGHASIVIPAFNAAKTVGELIRKLALFVDPAQIIVVDDGSMDSTARIADTLGTRLVQHERNLGKGRALRTGFAEALRQRDTEAVVTMDADLQHRPEDLPSFLHAWQTRKSDLLIGHRQRMGTSMPLARKLSNAITSTLVSARTGVRVLDSQCGFRLHSRQLLESVVIESDGYEAETELLIKALQCGFRVEFVPVRTVYAGEKSHMTHWRTTVRFLSVLLREY